MGSPVMAKTKIVLNQVINPANLSRIKDKSVVYGRKALDTSQRIYVKAKEVYQGPIRNGTLITTEFINLISKELSLFKNSQHVTFQNAIAEYNTLAEKLLPIPMRTRNKWFKGMVGVVSELTWRQVGEGALVVAEVVSLYYISKVVFKYGRKTLSIFA